MTEFQSNFFYIIILFYIIIILLFYETHSNSKYLDKFYPYFLH